MIKLKKCFYKIESVPLAKYTYKITWLNYECNLNVF